jgi:ferric-dicitrate binding protein FerR (iron transport regulator)
MLLKIVLLSALCLPLTVSAGGKVTFIKGKITALKLNESKAKPKKLKVGSTIKPGISYYSSDLSQVVIKLPDGTWVRIGSDTQFELQKERERFVIHLHTGTLRMLFSQKLQNSKTSTVAVKTNEAWVEAAAAKFTVTYMPIFNHTSVYVDKGLVQVSNLETKDAGVPESVYTGEFSEVVAREKPRSAKEMSEKEQRMLKTLLFSQLKEKKKDL